MKEEEEHHPNLDSDLKWLEGRLRVNPAAMGDALQGLDVPLQVYKTRCKDSCCKLGSSGGWRLIYSVNKLKFEAVLLLIYHKKTCENLSKAYLQQQLSLAMNQALGGEPEI